MSSVTFIARTMPTRTAVCWPPARSSMHRTAVIRMWRAGRGRPLVACFNQVPSFTVLCTFDQQKQIKLEGCIAWNDTIQYSAKAVRYPCTCFTSCIGRCLVSRACDRVMSALSAALLIFSF